MLKIYIVLSTAFNLHCPSLLATSLKHEIGTFYGKKSNGTPEPNQGYFYAIGRPF